ncbi:MULTISPECIES: FAD-dependent oxidoreductase [Prauserella salsuginis group]|uniref:FAD-dependent oxidoreductase n=1 Tax=Prauserella salsuginis TaxID=387889 RepID=A0ABW6G3L1_9PSEU|nr:MULTISPECIES: FAD-dependent oxidoreductase [Prauserella salsuginis group]MCR3718656.1 3-oxosteroid 1-dehydrogenase [Prauserella flava]MCR3733226.1 3-oxosteroid 1-dehydrogenase [Prauserella salsuginis]
MVDASEPVIVVGAGLSGLATALGAAVGGRDVIVFEAADQVGGAAAYSGGQVWIGANPVAAREGIEDSPELTETYVRAIARDAPEVLDEKAMLRWIRTGPDAIGYWEELGAIRWRVIPGLADYHNEADGALPVGRYLTGEVIDGSVLGSWRDTLRVSPYFPVGTTYDELMEKGRRATYVDSEESRSGKADHAGVPAFGIADGREFDATEGTDPLTFGTGVVASFLRRVLQEDRIDIRLSHPVTELLSDGGRVAGVRADGPDGPVEVRGPVVLATSTYDWDADLVREMVDLEPEDFGSVAPESLRGDGIKLARGVGAGIAKIPATSVPMLPGWRSQVGTGYGYGPEYAMPHTMIVDAAGNRFCNDSYWVDIVAKTLAPGDRHLPFFLVWDDQHRKKYGLAATPPGGEYPEGWVSSAPTFAALGEQLGIDGAQLTRTAERFNHYAARGEDPDFGRGTVTYVNKFAGDPDNTPSPVLGQLTEAPFHGLRLKFVGTGIGSSGVHIDGDGRVLDPDGDVIDGLYAVGSCAALTTTGTGYNSGFALGRGVTLAYLVARELRGEPVP